MSTGVAATLFDALIDDASLFPPGNLAMPAALSEHAAHRAGPYRHLLGRFLCPASRLDELRRLLPADAPEGGLPLGIILDAGLGGLASALQTVAGDARLDLAGVEIPIPAQADQAAAAHEILHDLGEQSDLLRGRLGTDVQAYVELPREYGWRDALGLISARGAGVKLRTGGPVAEAFPTELEVAEFVRACVAEGASFKCTAGLHHAVRHHDPETGFEHHGFVNVLVATLVAVEGGRVDDLAAILSEQDPSELVDAVRRADTATAAAARQYFTGYGTCSFDEPVDDLTGLGLIDKVSR